MALRFKCPSCQNDVIVRSQRIGDQVMCQKCGVTSVVPESAQSFDPDMLDYLHQQVPPMAPPPLPPQMPVQPLSSEDFGAILRDSFAIPFTKLPMIWVFAAVYAIPLGIFGYLMQDRMPKVVDPSNPFPILGQLFRLIAYFAAISAILTVLTKPGTYLALIDHLLGRKVRFFKVLGDSMPRAPWYLVAIIFTGLIAFAMMITVIGIPFAIFFSLTWAFVGVCAVVQQCNPVEALRESYYLVKGNWWRTLGLFLVVGIAAVGVVLIPMIIGAFAPEPIKTIISILDNMVLLVIFDTCLVLAYLRLKIEKQNFNLTELATLRDRLADPDDLTDPTA
jgi:hypothetical protein